jgi:imidazolonepropionase-like amidohydrolase
MNAHVDLVIKADRLIDGTGADALDGVAVWVRDGRIRAVLGPGEVMPELPSDAEVVRAPGQSLLPGLIDTHVHLAFSGGEDPLADLLRDDDARLLLRATANAHVALAAGITTVRDVGDRRGVVISLRDAIHDGFLAGPRIVASGPPITVTGGHCHWLGLEADSVDEVRKSARTLQRMGADVFKVMATGGGMTAGSVSEEAAYSVEALSALVEEGRRLGKPVAAHARGTPGIRNAVDAGVTTIEHCSWLGRDGSVAFDEQVASDIVQKGIFVNATLGLAYLPMTDAWHATPNARQTAALLPRRLAALRRQVEMGTKMTAGTDAGIALTPFDVLVQNVGVMVEHLGLSPLQAIRAATGLSAESLRLDHEIGTLQVGKRADLVLVEGNPVEDIYALRRVRRVLQGGRTVAIDGYMGLPTMHPSLYAASGRPRRSRD